MHCGIRLYQGINRSQHTGHAWYIAKTRFVTLLSTKMLHITTQLLWLLCIQAKSERSHYGHAYLTRGIRIAEGCHHASAWNKYLPPCTCNFGKQSFYTTGCLQTSSCTSQWVNATLKLPSPKLPPKHNSYLRIQRSARSSCPSWLSFITAVLF